ncbi:MAG: SDR family NAD(P)-dependent oxidoreductase [Planctomycetales bacterium]
MNDVARFIVFGATGGVGEALSRMLVESGAQVLLAGRNLERLKDLSQQLGMPNHPMDAADSDSIESVFQQAVSAFGRIDGVANCIGSVLLKPAHLTTDEEWQQTLTTNLFSAFAVVRGAARAMRQTGGSVVLVSTAATRLGLANHEAIAAAKAGIEGLTRSAAATYAGAGIRVNAVAPGLVKSNMTRRLWESPAAAETSVQIHALGRLGEPQDVARMIAFLLDQQNNWITGQVIGVDGGLGSVLARRRG